MLFNILKSKLFQSFINLITIIFLQQNFIILQFNINSFCDVAESFQLDFQEAATPSMEGIINFNYNLTFIICFILVFVSWLLSNCIFFYLDYKNINSSKFTHSNELEIVWTTIPAIILLFLATPSFSLLYSMDEIADPTLSFKIIGHQWYWSYEFSDYNYFLCGTNFEGTKIKYDCYMTNLETLPIEKQGYFRLLETNKRILLPIKTHIRLLVSSADVLHSWTVPSFGVKVDACPGRLNQINLFIKRAGLFFGQCSEICGVNHAFMPIAVACVEQKIYSMFVFEQMIKYVEIKIYMYMILLNINKVKNLFLQKFSSNSNTKNYLNFYLLFSLNQIKTKHHWHLVDPSPWPLLGSLSALCLTSGGVLYMHNYIEGFQLFKFGIFSLIFVMYVWWRDIVREATFEEQHNSAVQRGLRLGMLLFIISEIMFFFAFFWAFFHSSLAPVYNIGGVWPPIEILTIGASGIPLTNTIFLLSSGATVTYAHHGIRSRSKKHTIIGLIFTLILAILFTLLQGYEYIHAPFNINDSVFGSCFYITTGFHGFHVFIGTCCLFISFLRVIYSHFTTTHHFGFEAGIWYWHFVDVVWLFLFIMVYWWGSWQNKVFKS